MKLNKLFMLSALSILLVSGTTSCGGADKKLTVWVGNEEGTAEFYQAACDAWLAQEGNPYADYQIIVKGTDVGSIAGTITQDPKAAGDIYTVAHDNVGKLAAAKCAKPISETSLVTQVETDNPTTFVDVCKSIVNGKEALYAAPYISQACFLYYDKTKISDEEVKSFEGIMAAAKRNNCKGWTVPSSDGADGYNFSWSILSTRVSDHYTSLKLYEGASAEAGGTKGEAYCQGDDRIATLRWVQDALENPNGFKFASSDGWEKDLQNGACLGLINGSWAKNAVASAIGEANLGVALIPTFTLTENNVSGLDNNVVKAGDVYRGGTFADCKVFMLNANTDSSKYLAQQALVKYLSSVEMQTSAFEKQTIVPSATAASAQIDQLFNDGKVTQSQYDIAKVQVEMGAWGRPQPFITGTLNTYYYSKSAPAIYAAMAVKSNYPTTGTALVTNTAEVSGIRQGLYMMNYIWLKGKNPASIPTSLPAAIE